MKKRLILGLGMITLILFASGLFIILNLNQINSEERALDRLEEILARYGGMVEDIKGSQTELYRDQAGYGIDKQSLTGHLNQFAGRLEQTKKEYSRYLNRAECARCHSSGSLKFESVETRLTHIDGHLNSYTGIIRSFLGAKEKTMSRTLENRAEAEGQAMLSDMVELRHAVTMAKKRMEDVLMASIIRSRYAIVYAVLLGILLSATTFFFLFRSVTRPIDLLVHGIQEVSSGEYGARVEINSRDEIGFLAGRFNTMTENLARVTGQKEALISELQDLNGSLEQRVRQATDQLNAAHERMLRSETLSAVGTFASGVAHELATPLSSILSYFQMVKGMIAAEDAVAEDLSIIEQELLRCKTILRGMLDFARPADLEKSKTNINSVISGILALVKYQPAYKKVVVTEELDSGIPAVPAVPGQMKQVFLNIIMNALQSMSGGGKLAVSSGIALEGSNIVVRISDNGPGIPEDHINKIFQPFYTTRESGTGMGLAISYGIVKAHGGDIEVRSEKDHGTTFSIYLPLQGDVARQNKSEWAAGEGQETSG